MTPIVVFDTNILFSAVGWRGRPYQCVELAREGKITGVVCPEILNELVEKLQSKLHFLEDMAADFLGYLQLISIPGKLQFVANDPDDDAVLECAVEGHADFIITGDRRHLLPIGNYAGIEILTAVDFLKLEF